MFRAQLQERHFDDYDYIGWRIPEAVRLGLQACGFVFHRSYLLNSDQPLEALEGSIEDTMPNSFDDPMSTSEMYICQYIVASRLEPCHSGGYLCTTEKRSLGSFWPDIGPLAAYIADPVVTRKDVHTPLSPDANTGMTRYISAEPLPNE